MFNIFIIGLSLWVDQTGCLHYPNSSFLYIGLGLNLSHIWKIILVAQDLLRDEIIWRIRDGASIDIYVDNGLSNLYLIQELLLIFILI